MNFSSKSHSGFIMDHPILLVHPNYERDIISVTNLFTIAKLETQLNSIERVFAEIQNPRSAFLSGSVQQLRDKFFELKTRSGADLCTIFDTVKKYQIACEKSKKRILGGQCVCETTADHCYSTRCEAHLKKDDGTPWKFCPTCKKESGCTCSPDCNKYRHVKDFPRMGDSQGRGVRFCEHILTCPQTNCPFWHSSKDTLRMFPETTRENTSYIQSDILLKDEE